MESIISLSDFRNTFNKAEPASPARFSLDIINVSNVGSSGEDQEFASKYPQLFQQGYLRFRCQHSDLPGRSIGTSESGPYGPTRKFAMNSIYAPINVGVVVTDGLAERKLFEDWLDLVISSTKNGSEETHDVNYYDTYASFVANLKTYDKIGNVSAEYQLDEAFPISISPAALDWNAVNQTLVMQVELAYRMWRRVK